MRVRKNFLLAFLIVCLFTFSSALWSLDLPQQQEPPQNPPIHGPFQGKKFCYNTGKEKNCDCHRLCINGQPGKDNTCKNYCYEDKCKCRTKCNS